MADLPDGTIVIHGDAEGADTCADFEARARGFPVRSSPAQWHKYGPAAGPIRNQQMLDEEHPDKDGVPIGVFFAFAADFATSKGTRDMVRRALLAGISGWVIDSKSNRTRMEPEPRPEPLDNGTEPTLAWELLPED
jgi:hypothetical protein